MITRSLRPALLATALLATLPAAAQDLLVRGATVHTASAQGTLADTDVLVLRGRIAAIGKNLGAPAGISVVQANGQALTPTLFGGISELGAEEVSGVEATADSRLRLEDQPARPEFDLSLAFNPDSLLLPVARAEGIGFSALAPNPGGSFIAGQGAVIRTQGDSQPLPSRQLYLSLGGNVSAQSGQSRAAQWMLLAQMLEEARGNLPASSPHALLSPAGRKALASYLAGNGRIMVRVDRASDIAQLLRWAAREKVRIGIVGGAEAWKQADALAAAKVPVFLETLVNLPASFDQLGARADAAALLAAAGVEVSYVLNGDGAHNARKLRQSAGNAVGQGLPWETAYAGLTSVPARALGVDDELGSIAIGKRADLVLWDGDPLDVAHVARRVWMGGVEQALRSRQTELRDRYQAPAGSQPRAYLQPSAPRY